MIRGGKPENLFSPISNGHLPSDHNFHLYSFVGLRLKQMGDFPHPLLILYQIGHVMSSFFLRLIRDRERNRTSPNRWIPLSILSNDIETHGASTVSTPVMP